MSSTDGKDHSVLRRGFVESEFGRLLWIFIILLLLQIPLIQVGGLIDDRIVHRDEARMFIEGVWGGHQTLTGPRQVVPVVDSIEESELQSGQQIVTSSREVTRYAVYLPEEADFTGELASDVRRRGVFDVPVYTLQMSVRGEFQRPDVDELQTSGSEVRWADAYLAFRVTDLTSVQKVSALNWSDAELEFQPASDGTEAMRNDLIVPLDLSGTASSLPFSFEIELNGSGGLKLVPVGQQSTASISSDWPDPSFSGTWLPSDYSVGLGGFSARWFVPYLSRSFPQQWISSPGAETTLNASFGVDLISLVDNYRLVERSVKYASLLLILTFATIWLIDVLTKTPVHPIQYLLVGAALAVFYLLLVSLSEYVDFGWAYLVSALVVLAKTSTYTSAVLSSNVRATFLAALLGFLYFYLYIVLNLVEFSLLAGATVVVVALAATMYFTRRVDWFTLGRAA